MWRWLVVLAAAGCGRHINPAWCAQPGHSDPACPVDAGIDTAAGSCTRDADCPGTACLLPEGVCAAPAAMLYVSPTGAGAACTSTAKCALGTAIEQSTTERNLILMDRASYTGAIAIDHAVRILGNGATLEGPSVGAAVVVTSGVAVELERVTITGTAAGSAISCTSGSLTARGVVITGNQLGITSACALTVTGSVLSDNSDGALVIVSGAIAIRNNFIVNNGNPMLGRSANVTIAAGVTGAFSFNTVAYNDTKANSTPGVDCAATGLVATGNLITDNTHKGGFDVDPQVTGVCDFSQSYTLPGAGGNDLHWVNVAASDFHLTAASTAVIDSPGLTCAGLDDFDGDVRPLGAGCEFGADEYRP
ncbi:MAG TPA: hypothetical protein VHW23_41825 [Kofleriaceae bacterium]|jgi:hypothetical protein|nr:hypothetical protein [Kofleriaceae bacterium]